MKIFITKLDNGFTLSVTFPATPLDPERKERYAFEHEGGLYRKLNQLIPIDAVALADIEEDPE